MAGARGRSPATGAVAGARPPHAHAHLLSPQTHQPCVWWNPNAWCAAAGAGGVTGGIGAGWVRAEGRGGHRVLGHPSHAAPSRRPGRRQILSPKPAHPVGRAPAAANGDRLCRGGHQDTATRLRARHYLSLLSSPCVPPQLDATNLAPPPPPPPPPPPGPGLAAQAPAAPACEAARPRGRPRGPPRPTPHGFVMLPGWPVPRPLQAVWQGRGLRGTNGGEQGRPERSALGSTFTCNGALSHRHRRPARVSTPGRRWGDGGEAGAGVPGDGGRELGRPIRAGGRQPPGPPMLMPVGPPAGGHPPPSPRGEQADGRGCLRPAVGPSPPPP